jgi:hypothetical protein
MAQRVVFNADADIETILQNWKAYTGASVAELVRRAIKFTEAKLREEGQPAIKPGEVVPVTRDDVRKAYGFGRGILVSPTEPRVVGKVSE